MCVACVCVAVCVCVEHGSRDACVDGNGKPALECSENMNTLHIAHPPTQANNEILVGVFRGRWCFLPGSSCLKRTAWKSFTKDMESVATHIRKLSRLLWMIHLNFEEVRACVSSGGRKCV